MKRFLKALGTGAGTALLVATGLFALAYGIRQIDPVLDQIHLAPLLLRFLSPEMIGAWSLFAAVFAALSVMLERHRLVRLLVFGLDNASFRAGRPSPRTSCGSKCVKPR
ncbi:hypothetical protein [uncultured Dubosiella sp.]|uniref:hypothetical protein n=2 Tax=uncultured Dubosiella sp. TaxID=1937011 RepID=UPI002594ACEB|nr:hypothetical protein [uncultured Dubosiella sp.]